MQPGNPQQNTYFERFNRRARYELQHNSLLSDFVVNGGGYPAGERQPPQESQAG